MLNLSKEQMERRVALLKELYEEGYRYIGATSNGNALAGKDYNFKMEALGIWGLKDAKNIRINGIDEDLFLDVKWEDEALFDIEDAMAHLKMVNEGRNEESCL